MRHFILSSLIVCALGLSGCAPVLIGSVAVTGTAVAVDRRSVGDVTNDNIIETKASLHLTQANFASSHITTTAYEGRVLLTGEIGNDEDRQNAEEIAKGINGVTTVYNELEVMDSSSLTTRFNDSILASKIRASLVDAKDVTLTAVKVVVERDIVYLTGTVTEDEAQKILAIVSKVNGVVKVVNLFTIITLEELQKRMLTNQSSDQDANQIKESTYMESSAGSQSSKDSPVAVAEPI